MVKHALKVRSDRNLMSSSEEEEAQKDATKVLKKRSRDEMQMHGATIVP